jgi:hypothetical protein
VGRIERGLEQQLDAAGQKRRFGEKQEGNEFQIRNPKINPDFEFRRKSSKTGLAFLTLFLLNRHS